MMAVKTNVSYSSSLHVGSGWEAISSANSGGVESW